MLHTFGCKYCGDDITQVLPEHGGVCVELERLHAENDALRDQMHSALDASQVVEVTIKLRAEINGLRKELKDAKRVRRKRLEKLGFEEPTETQKAGGDFGRG